MYTFIAGVVFGIDNPIVPNAGRILKSYFIKVSNLCFDVLED